MFDGLVCGVLASAELKTLATEVYSQRGQALKKKYAARPHKPRVQSSNSKMFSRASVTRAILLSVLACPNACVRASRRRCARLRDAARLIRRGGAAAAGETGAAVMPPIDEEYDLLLTEDFGGGGGGGAGFPSHNGDDETLLYPTLASTTSMPKTDTKKAFFLLGLIGAVADLDRRAFFVVVAVTNLYAMRFLKAYVRPTLTKWMCCNTQFLVWKSTSSRWRWRRKLIFHTGNSSTVAWPAR